MSYTQRIVIASLSLSAAGLIGLVTDEGYSGQATIPVKGDPPTMGFGSTTHADGTKVRLGERTDPVSALQRTLIYVQKADADIRRCVKTPLHQAEYDVYANFVYQYGAGAFCGSSIVRKLNAQQYVQACESLLMYRFSGGFDCSTPGNKVCPGSWGRQLERHAQCMAAQ